MTQEMLFSKYAEQYPLTVPQEAVENELQLLILEEKQRIQYETLTGFAVHLSPQEELNKKMEALQAEALRRAKEMLVLREIMAAQTFPVTPRSWKPKLRRSPDVRIRPSRNLSGFSAKTSPCCKAT